MNKICIVGAGRVGETAASILAQHNLCNEVALLDVRDGAAAGAALDILQSASGFGFDTTVTGSTTIADKGLHVHGLATPMQYSSIFAAKMHRKRRYKTLI